MPDPVPLDDRRPSDDRRPPDARRRRLVLLAAVLLSPLVAEGAVRLAGVEGVVLHRQSGRLMRGAKEPLPHQPRPNASATVEYRERDGTLLRRARMTVNGEGYRGPIAGPIVDDRRPRIVCLGDSHTFGWGVDDGEPWPRVLEARLRAGSATEAEVLNLGVDGFASTEEVVWLRREGLPRSPDVVLWQWFVNDLQLGGDNDERPPWKRSMARWTSPWMGGWIGQLRRVSRIADQGLQAVHARLVQTRGHFENVAASLDHLEAWERARTAVLQGREETDAAGARFVVVAFPLLVRDGDTFASRPVDVRVIDALREHGIECIDLGVLLPAERARELRNSDIDYHPSALGHRLAAEAVARELRSRGQLESAQPREASPSGVSPPGTPR
ncbi:MAG: SGNH/GDSL hydrolase family protein [Planctomycetota bacterium]